MRPATILWFGLCMSFVLSQDCMRFYRRDVMETWRVPIGSSLCNITMNCTNFNATAKGNSLEIATKAGKTTLGQSFAGLGYFSKRRQSVLLRMPGKLQNFAFDNSGYFETGPYCTTSYDGWYEEPTYILAVSKNDLLVEGTGTDKVAYFAQYVAMLQFLAISFFKTDKFYFASVGYPVFLSGWILLTNIFEVNMAVLLFGLLVITASTLGSIHLVSKQLPEKQTQIATWLNVAVSAVLWIRSSYACAAFALILCLFMWNNFRRIKSVETIPDPIILCALTSKFKESYVFLFTWLFSAMFQLEVPLPLLLSKFRYLDPQYPIPDDLLQLISWFIGPIVACCLSGLVCLHTRKFKNQFLTSDHLTQEYFAPPEYPAYGQQPLSNAGYQNQYATYAPPQQGLPQYN